MSSSAAPAYRSRGGGTDATNDGFLVSAFKSLDLFPKVATQIDEKPTLIKGTSFGGALSIPVVIVLCWLTLSEVYHYIWPPLMETMLVDNQFNERMEIEIDIEFPRIACESVGIDLMDVTGEQQVHVNQRIIKRRLDYDGNTLGFDSSDEHYEEDNMRLSGIPPFLRAMGYA